MNGNLNIKHKNHLKRHEITLLARIITDVGF